ncbi:MAG: ATP-binding protein, partial [Candidatus Dormibacteria bacterium]
MEDAVGGVIGRDPERLAIANFLTALGRGFTQLTLEGEAGIGKTTLWWEALRQASSRGAHVIATRPSESEATLSFAALADLFDGVDDSMIDRLPIPQREAIAAALLRAPAPLRGIDELALCAAVLSLLRLLAAEGPLVVAVDDAHWLDPPSARALIFAARRLHSESVAFVLTIRTGTTRPLRLDRAADPNRRHMIKVGPLTLAALHEVIKQRTQQSLPRHALVQIERATGGNALYALEIAAELIGRPADDRVLPVPSSLTDLVAARLGR